MSDDENDKDESLRRKSLFFQRVNINFALFNFYFNSTKHIINEDTINILWSNNMFNLKSWKHLFQWNEIYI